MMMPKTIKTEDGKTAGKNGSAIGSGEGKEKYDPEVIQRAQQHFSYYAQAIIEPARRQVLREHRFTERDFIELCYGHPFVPKGRELIFAKGLYRGFVGDLLEASHILVPQIENSLRYVLSKRGVITSSLRSDGIQEEYSLGTILEKDELEQVFGEDLVFSLHCILNSKFGSNFRHRLAHGLLDQYQFHSIAGIYTWWLVLHLIFLPIEIQEID